MTLLPASVDDFELISEAALHDVLAQNKESPPGRPAEITKCSSRAAELLCTSCALFNHATRLAASHRSDPAQLRTAGRYIAAAILTDEKAVVISPGLIEVMPAIVDACKESSFPSLVIMGFLLMSQGKMQQAGVHFERLAAQMEAALRAAVAPAAEGIGAEGGQQWNVELDDDHLDAPVGRSSLLASVYVMAGHGAFYSQQIEKCVSVLDTAFSRTRVPSHKARVLALKMFPRFNMPIAQPTRYALTLADGGRVVELLDHDYTEHGLSSMHYMLVIANHGLGRQDEAIVALEVAKYCEGVEKRIYGRAAAEGSPVKRLAESTLAGVQPSQGHKEEVAARLKRTVESRA